jgi:hypothetical protein
MATSLCSGRGWCNTSGPFVAVLYTVFSLTDLLLSAAASALGIPEGNPLLASLARDGLFVPAKLLLTLIAAVLIVALYSRGRVRPVAWSGVVIMASVDIYHLWGLSGLMPMG